MRHRIMTLLLGFAVLVTAGCGFQLRGTTQIPAELQKLQISTGDPYGAQTRAIRQQLRLNNVQIIESGDASIPVLKIISSSEGSEETVSVFQDGKAAEKELVYFLNAQVIMPNGSVYPLSVRVERSFFDNPLEALAKDAEKDMVRDEMREQAAARLIRKLLVIQPSEQQKQHENAQAAEIVTPKA
ncbi:LPS assembly lipoprotein LptE [Morganella psychrotolerans]|nr:LPS assembly lipoprotein LptE [Morganella psychrotolerans]